MKKLRSLADVGKLVALTRWPCTQLPPVIAAILRVAAVAAPIFGRALVDAYRQAMISELLLCVETCTLHWSLKVQCFFRAVWHFSSA